MKTKIIVLLLAFLALSLPVQAGWIIEANNPDVDLELVLNKNGAEIKIKVPLTIGNPEQNQLLLKHLAELVKGFANIGWKRGFGQINMAIVGFEYEERGHGYEVFIAIYSPERNPGRFKCRDNSVYMETVPREVEKIIERKFIQK